MVENPLDKLGAAIKAARLHSGMTQSELADSLGISRRYLVEIESGRQKPGLDVLFGLIQRLAIPLEDIFYPDRVHDQKDLEEVVAMLHYCNERELSAISAALHAIMRFK